VPTQWPEVVSFKSFCKALDFNDTDFYTGIFQCHDFNIKNQRIAIKRLKTICEATFYLANHGGFHSMTLRQLSRQSQMSMGGLYAYIDSKEDLAHLIYSALNNYCQAQIDRLTPTDIPAEAQLGISLRLHLYLSELLQPWFYFAFMEARSLNNQLQMALESEQVMENKIVKLVSQGIKEGDFEAVTPKVIRLKAALVKAMLQDWYLKHGKYKKRRVTVDQYAEQLLDMTFSNLKTGLTYDY
jgi:AcrR family transcriptional regulator